MPVPGASKTSRDEAPVAANAGRSNRFKAPGLPTTPKSRRHKALVVPDSPKNNRIKAPAATKVVFNPREFVRIQALPGFAQKGGKVLARSRTVYKSSEPLREEVFWENYHRRQKQFSQGLFTPTGKPYRELGEILYTNPKKLTLYALGQLPQIQRQSTDQALVHAWPAHAARPAKAFYESAFLVGESTDLRIVVYHSVCIFREEQLQELVKKDVQEKPPKEVAEVTTNKYSCSPESDLPEAVEKLTPFRETKKELRTLDKALARSRYHINFVKQGGDYFHILHQESLERKNTLKAAEQPEDMGWRTEFQLPKYSSDAEESEEEIDVCSLSEGNHLRKSGKKKRKITLQSFTPLHTSVLISSPPEAKSEQLFRQLCAIHWLLEALTLERSSSMHSILTCWNPKDPGGCKKRVKEIEEEKLATHMWELFITNTKKRTWKARYGPPSRKINGTSTPGISQFSSQSSPCGSIASTLLCSEDSVKINVASSDIMSESAQAKEQQPIFPSLQKVTQITHEEVSRDVHKEEDTVKTTGRMRCHIGSFIKSKSNLCADMRQKFTAVREEAACALHDTLETLERTQEERCCQKYQALNELKYFGRDMETIRQLGMNVEREYDEDGLNWFPVLLARLPESVKNDHYVQKILKKLEKYGKSPDLKIHPDTFLKVLADLQVWELCSPEIAAAVEFVRGSIVQMPEKDFSKWFQTRIAPLSAQCSTF